MRSSSMRSAAGTPAGRFTVAWLAGALPAGVLFWWMVTEGSWDPLRYVARGGFFDAQAHALLAGHLSVSRQVLGIEAFTGRHGHAFMYFGPFPALLRLPIAALGRSPDGHLACLSLLLAWTTAMAALARVAWLIRERMLGPVRVLERHETLGIAGLAVLAGAGSTLFFDGDRAWVYEEASAWGLATSLLAFGCLMAFQRSWRPRSLAWACAWSVASMLTRPSVGLGPVVALAVLAGIGLWKRMWPAHQAPTARKRPRWACLAAAAAAPLAAYMAINWLKFGALIGIPFAHWHFAEIDAAAARVIHDTGGSIFGAKFAPENLLTYLRPTGLAVQSVFPWVDFPDGGGARVARLVARAPTASIPASMPAWSLLAALGAVRLARRRPDDRSNERGLAPLVLAAIAGTVPVIAVAGQSERYTVDSLPALFMAGLIGAFALLHPALEGIPTRLRRFLGALVILAGVMSCWVMFALALMSQRLDTGADSKALSARLISWQLDLPSLGARPPVLGGPGPPRLGRREQLYIVGDCRALYVSTGGPADGALSRTNWLPVERTPDVGDVRFLLRLPRSRPGTIGVLADLGRRSGQLLVARAADGGLIFAIRALVPSRSPTVRLSPGPHQLEIDADQRTGSLTVTIDGRHVVQTLWGEAGAAPDPRLDRVHADRSAGALLTPLPPAPTPLCHRLLRLAHA